MRAFPAAGDLSLLRVTFGNRTLRASLGMALLVLQPISGGCVALGGQRIDNADRTVLRAMRKRMQVVFQDPFASLSPRMRVFEILGRERNAAGR